MEMGQVRGWVSDDLGLKNNLPSLHTYLIWNNVVEGLLEVEFCLFSTRLMWSSYGTVVCKIICDTMVCKIICDTVVCKFSWSIMLCEFPVTPYIYGIRATCPSYLWHLVADFIWRIWRLNQKYKLKSKHVYILCQVPSSKWSK